MFRRKFNQAGIVKSDKDKIWLTPIAIELPLPRYFRFFREDTEFNFTLFQGMEVHGVPEYVIVEGRVCVDECELKAVHGFGKFVETPSHVDYVYSMIEDREKVRLSFYG